MFKNSIKVLTVAAAAAALVACGGGSDGPVKKAATDTTYNIGKAKGQVDNIKALPPVTLAYNKNGLKQVKHEGDGKATFTDTADKTVNGTVETGSCIFKPSEAIGTLTAGQAVTFNPCKVSVATQGVVAGSSKEVDAKVTLGTNAPVTTKVTAAVTDKGKVAVGGSDVGSVQFITGGGN